ncbi:DUF2975 domain-containing protein [Clostridium sp. B9]|uniref:DUF2975 domain-containing protein n=1 Tax=Clostridium sp. B9 TaxID=3423224 RepID=UPI003D2F2C83
MRNNITSKLLDYTVILGITLTILALIGMPLILTAFFKSNFSLSNQSLIWIVTACIYLCAIPFVIALFKVKKICGFIKNDNPFSRDIIKSVQVICICSFSEIITFSLSLIYLKYSVDFFKHALIIAPILIISFLCVTIGLLCLVVAGLFEKFIDIKEENDSTI